MQGRKNQINTASWLPMSRAEMKARGWSELDILLIGGDCYVDHPAFGLAVIGRVLEAEGWRVGIVAQPDWRQPSALQAMGRPRLFCGVSAGNLDSMLANQTAARRRRREDAYSENGDPGRRPNYASIVYANLARQAFPGITVVLGGIEASMRRLAHYDYWQDRVRPSILQESKASILVYGMGEQVAVEIARRCQAGQPLTGIRGTARMAGASEAKHIKTSDYTCLPSFQACREDSAKLLLATRLTEQEQNPFSGQPLAQPHGTRLVVVEAPARPLNSQELDQVYELPYTRLPHPVYQKPIPAWKTVADSFTVVRGCGGGCSFCGLGLHQGRWLSSRTIESVAREVTRHSRNRTFRGTITDLGGPSANLYGCQNGVSPACHACRQPSCLFPSTCRHLKLTAEPSLELLRRISRVKGVKHVFIQSGIRMDVALRFPGYLQELAAHHVSGHLKVAPEHLHPDVLRRMRKSESGLFERFRQAFAEACRSADREQYLVPYFIANFPGCGNREMAMFEDYLASQNWNLRQVQDFIPLPMTAAAASYHSGLDYETGKPIRVVRGLAERRRQMRMLRQPVGQPSPRPAPGQRKS